MSVQFIYMLILLILIFFNFVKILISRSLILLVDFLGLLLSGMLWFCCCRGGCLLLFRSFFCIFDRFCYVQLHYILLATCLFIGGFITKHEDLRISTIISFVNFLVFHYIFQPTDEKVNLTTQVE